MKNPASTFMAFSLSMFVVLAGTGVASAETVGNLNGSFTFPSTVKLPSGNCGTFPVKFKLGARAKAMGIVFGQVLIGNSKGDPVAESANVLWEQDGGFSYQDAGKANGSTFTSRVKFCKKAWISEWGDAYAGATPGSKRVEITITVLDAEYFEVSDLTFVQ